MQLRQINSLHRLVALGIHLTKHVVHAPQVSNRLSMFLFGLTRDLHELLQIFVVERIV